MSDDKRAEALEAIEAHVAELGRQLNEKRDAALLILKGRVARVRGNRFRIENARVYLGGLNTRIFFEGPRLKQDGSKWATARESCPLALFEMIEPSDHPDNSLTDPSDMGEPE